MRLLFVTSNLLGARFIRWGLGTDCSHFAVCFDEDSLGRGIVFHSYGVGAQLEWLGHFQKKNITVHSLEFVAKLTLQEEEGIYKSLLSEYYGEGYDYKALLYWTWRGILNKFFKVPLPPKNRWAVDGYQLCTGLAKGVQVIAELAKTSGMDLEMVKPHDLYHLLLDSGFFKIPRVKI